MMPRITTKASQLHWLSTNFPSVVPKFITINSTQKESIFLEKILDFFSADARLILRPSVLGEDQKKHSFAGLFESVGNVAINKLELKKARKKALNSLNSSRVLAYLSQQQLPPITSSKLIVQEYVKSAYSGVAFIYPDSLANSTVSIGQATAVTDGDNEELSYSLASIPENELPSDISVAQWRKFHGILKRVAKKYGKPADIEWAIDKNHIWLLQIRPITAETSLLDQLVFDATNIGENYPGVTAPLTFSFISEAYTQVYSQFLRLLNTPEFSLTKNRYVLSNMLAYVHGSLYYNLDNWYRILKMLPFYSINKKFFNRMLSPVKADNESDFTEIKCSLLTSLSFIWYMLFPFRAFSLFRRNFSKSYSEYQLSRSSKTQQALFQKIYAFEKMRDSFFSLWSYTIINDFRVMISFGLLSVLAEKSIDKPQEYLNSLITVGSTPESMEPLLELQRLANTANKNEVVSLILKKPAQEAWDQLKTSKNTTVKLYFQKLELYLTKYGNRSAQELKLEQPKFREDPAQFIAILQQYLLQPISKKVQKTKTAKPIKFTKPILRPLLFLLKNITVKGIYRREQFRLNRGQAYGIARETFLELGQELSALGELETSQDVFYLTYHELRSFILFQSLPLSPREIVKTRKKMLQFYARQHSSQRLTTRSINNGLLQTDTARVKRSKKLFLQGTPTSITSAVVAPVVVMNEFSSSVDIVGKIIITKKTDPGWTVLFPLAAGVVTEYGSTLSHASIIARELGIPCLTGATGCTELLKTGDKIILSTSAGTITMSGKV